MCGHKPDTERELASSFLRKAELAEAACRWVETMIADSKQSSGALPWIVALNRIVSKEDPHQETDSVRRRQIGVIRAISDLA
mgnify:CR=1 FL=1